MTSFVNEIVLIRHAESEFNVWKAKVDEKTKHLQPITLINSSITKTGQEQAKKLNVEVDLLLVSSLKRCKQTFEHSNIKAKNVIYDKLFREHQIEICDYFTEEIIEIFSDNYKSKYVKNGLLDINLSKWKHETVDDLLDRIVKINKRLSQYQKTYQKIGILCHGDLIYWMKSTKWIEKIENCCVMPYKITDFTLKDTIET